LCCKSLYDEEEEEVEYVELYLSELQFLITQKPVIKSTFR
jgi:hypothetical protein